MPLSWCSAMWQCAIQRPGLVTSSRMSTVSPVLTSTVSFQARFSSGASAQSENAFRQLARPVPNDQAHAGASTTWQTSPTGRSSRRCTRSRSSGPARCPAGSGTWASSQQSSPGGSASSRALLRLEEITFIGFVAFCAFLVCIGITILRRSEPGPEATGSSLLARAYLPTADVGGGLEAAQLANALANDLESPSE